MTSESSKLASRRRTTITIVIAIVVVLIVAGVGVGLYEHQKGAPKVVKPPNPNQLVSVENEPINSVDPATGFYAGEDEVMSNVYQGFVMYNVTTPTASSIEPIIASNWTHSSNYTIWNFNLRSSVTFENGNGYNAYDAWFNFYRTILMGQVGAYYFNGLLYNGTLAFETGYSVPQGVVSDFEANGYTNLTTENISEQQKSAAYILADILSNFNPNNSTVQSIMKYPGQAVVVTGEYSIQFNLIHSYPEFLSVLAVPGAGQIDPSFVDMHGGVVPNSQNVYVNTHTMGTGPYYVESYTPGELLILQENPNYWAKNLPASQTNVMLTVPHIPTIIIEYTTEQSTMISDLLSNTATLIGGPPTLPALSPSSMETLSNSSGIITVNLVNSPKFVFLMAALDCAKYPYNETGFRLALAHALNYSELISSIMGPYGTPMVGPISPGYAYYNPDNLSMYSYDPSYSISVLKSMGIYLKFSNGTVINPAGTKLNLQISYVTSDQTQIDAAQEMQKMFSEIGLSFTLNPLTVQSEESLISQPGNASSYPGMLLWDWYPSWLDPVYQDMVVQLNSYYSGIAGDVSNFNNATVNNITSALPYITNATLKMKLVKEVYNITYAQAPDLWLWGINPVWAQQSYLKGVYFNTGVLGFYYPLMYYSG
ncbi:MAG: ABC transporter substrate-binding protein [Conexivisphaerales archaeon]